MNKDTYKTDMMFRFDITKDWRGTVFAIMPYEIGTLEGDVMNYQHVGQHSNGDYYLMIKNSRPATEAEYKDLKEELESFGYNIKVVKKQNYNRYLKNLYEARNIE